MRDVLKKYRDEYDNNVYIVKDETKRGVKYYIIICDEGIEDYIYNGFRIYNYNEYPDYYMYKGKGFKDKIMNGCNVEMLLKEISDDEMCLELMI